jgi:hypothetical protein
MEEPVNPLTLLLSGENVDHLRFVEHNGFGAKYRCKNGTIITIVSKPAGYYMADNGWLYNSLGYTASSDMSRDIAEHIGYDVNFKKEPSTEQ